MTNKSSIGTNPGKELCFDFHIHSKFSYDSLLSPKRILRIAKKRGLDGIAITDHNTIRGALEASKFNNSLSVIIGSDAHISKSIGTVRTFFNGEKHTIQTVEDVKRLLLKGAAEVVGTESPRYVHYFSATVGNVRKGNLLQLGKLFAKEFRTVLNKKT